MDVGLVNKGRARTLYDNLMETDLKTIAMKTGGYTSRGSRATTRSSASRSAPRKGGIHDEGLQRPAKCQRYDHPVLLPVARREVLAEQGTTDTWRTHCRHTSISSHRRELRGGAYCMRDGQLFDNTRQTGITNGTRNVDIAMGSQRMDDDSGNANAAKTATPCDAIICLGRQSATLPTGSTSERVNSDLCLVESSPAALKTSR